MAPLPLIAALALAATQAGAEPMTRDHDELPRVTACQERLAAAVEKLRLELRGYDLALEIRAAERPETARSETIVTCRLSQTDAVPALTDRETR